MIGQPEGSSYEQYAGQGGQYTNQGGEMRDVARQQRLRSEHLAEELSTEASQQWRRTMEGVLAFPTALALGFASSTLYVGAFIERGFEVFQRTAEAVQSGVQRSKREMRERREGTRPTA